MTPEFDVAVIGGGLAGASLACALEGRGWKTALVELHAPDSETRPGFDDRGIALSEGSRRIFESIGIWPHIAHEVESIRHIHVSDRGGFGFTRMDAASEGLPALGYVAPARVLSAAMVKALEPLRDTTVIAPARLADIRVGAEAVDLFCQKGDEPGNDPSADSDGKGIELRARLVVAADGAFSTVRARLGVGIHTRPYGQHAVVANVVPGKAHGGVAYERFTDTGPLALLPLTEGRCAVVWSVLDTEVEKTLALTDEEFLAGLQERFGWRLGRFRKVGRRQSFPLRLMEADEQVRPRIAILGNAAHALHPIGGQGFNLGLRDVAALADVIGDGACADPGGLEVLERFQQARRADLRKVTGFTHGLARLFSNRTPGPRLGRNLGLFALDLLPAARSLLVRHAAGVAGDLPRAALGRGAVGNSRGAVGNSRGATANSRGAVADGGGPGVAGKATEKYS
ncbi:MAG: 2-octaprenyl-6-methoxyphenyl hydroxylase [Gammaproteobacteria bacterium]